MKTYITSCAGCHGSGRLRSGDHNWSECIFCNGWGSVRRVEAEPGDEFDGLSDGQLQAIANGKNLGDVNGKPNAGVTAEQAVTELDRRHAVSSVPSVSSVVSKDPA